MSKSVLIGLLAAGSLLLGGCALSPQQLNPQPRLQGSLVAVGQGQPVQVRVVDGRPSPVLGTRGGLYPETSTISVDGQRMLPRLQAEADAAVRLLGFVPGGSGYNVPQLTLTLAELKYQSPKEGSYVTEANIPRVSVSMCKTAIVATAVAMARPSTSVLVMRPMRKPTVNWLVMCSVMR